MDDTPASPSSSGTDALDELLAAHGAEPLPPAADGIAAFRVARDALLELMPRLKAAPASFEMLLSLTAVDWYEREPRYEVVYHLWSLTHNRLLRLKVGVPEEDATCPSVVEVWSGADWLEREVFDLFGIRFDGHPDLRRILLPDSYPYHPLRKDFPLAGLDNAVSYLKEGGVLMTTAIEVDRPPGQDPTPVDLSRGDPADYSDGAEER